ncbi:MAG: helicase-associated domain-containing protein, partial [Thermomicrobiales bacterium]
GLSVYAAPENVPPARQRVLAELAEFPAGEWVALDHLISRLRIRAYEFLFSRTPSRDSYYAVNYRYYGFGHFNPYQNSINGLGVTLDIESERAGWDVAEAGVIRVIVTEALDALGVVDLGGDGDTPTAFRITDDGARLLRGEPLALDETAALVVIQPNFQIFAFQPTGADILFMLDRIADRRNTGQAMEYELTRESIYRAQQAGLDTTAVLDFLEQVSAHELPQNVRRTLEEWGSQHERITLRRRAPLLQTADEAALDALYADEALAPLLGRRLAPTLALVPGDQLQAVYRRLIEGGQLPTLSEGSGFQPGPQLDVRADGVIEFRQPQPSIYTLHALRPFAEASGGRLQLTPASLRQGARTGLDAEAVIATLERLSGGALPDKPVALVRRWAKDWGSGAIYDATILQLDQPQQLADLLADPEIQPHLQPIPGAPTLAIVQPRSRKRLRTLLEARGMTLQRDA